LAEIVAASNPRLNDPKALLAALADNGVRFVIVGGVAMVIHGSASLTEDLDVVYRRDDSDLEAVVRALSPFRPRLRVAGDAAEVRLSTSAGDIDLFGEIPGVGRYEDAHRSSEQVSIDNRVYRVLSLSGLIHAKRAAGRPKDLQAIPELEHLLEIEELRGKEPR
jgi:predicted nucleotidyltransferase